MVTAWGASLHCKATRGTNDSSSGESTRDWGEKQTLKYTPLSITIHTGHIVVTVQTVISAVCVVVSNLYMMAKGGKSLLGLMHFE